jgi:hypothetical protein
LAVFARLDGADYKLYKLTSSNFTSWTGPAEISVGGLTSTLRKFDPFLIQIIGGDIWLLFAYTEALDGSGAERSNLYYSVSSNDGATWSDATKVTNYTLFSQIGTHPTAVQQAAGTIRILCNEVMTALNIDENTTGLDGAIVEPSDMTFDPVTRKLYVVSSHVGAGTKFFYCVFKVDVDTWTVQRKWDLSSVPSFPSAFDVNHNVGYSCHRGERYLIPIGITNQSGSTCVSLLNADTEEGTITNYIFDSIPAYGLTKNVTHSLMADYYLGHTWVDFENGRLYCLFYYGRRVIIGYIDTDEIGPNYNFHTIIDDAEAAESGTIFLDVGFLLLPTEDLVIVSNHCKVSNWPGFVQIYQLSTGAEYKRYTMAEQAGFPLHGIGLGRLAWIDGHIYGTFTYESLYGETDKRGLCDIDTTLDTVICHRPSWATLDEYGLSCCKATEDGRLIISTNGYGVTFFDPIAQTWELYNTESVPGLYGEGDADTFWTVEFDDAGGFVFAGRLALGGDAGLTMFSEYGYMRQAQYIEGLFGTVWTFGVPTPLVSGYTDFDAVGALDPSDSSMYAFWTNETGNDYKDKWGKEGATLALTPHYLLKGYDVVFKEGKGYPSRVEFSVSHGHLFDPSNTNSLLSIYLKKGRKITLEWGDKVGTNDYWQPQGTFVITDTKMPPGGRGQYPIMHVVAQDRRCTWDHHQVRATDYYETFPENILSDVLSEHLGFVPAGSPGADIDLPVFANREPIYIQSLDAMAKDIVDQICDRFGYYPRMTVDDKFSARRISASNPVDHVYADNTRIKDFTPDDSFSDFTNRVIVTGFERTEIEVLYGEERIETISGTVGWWGFKKDFNVYYSKDGSRRCRDPRLVVLESSTSIAFYLAGRISEEISHVDADELYCVIHVEAPNLIPVLLAALAVAVVGYGIGDGWFGVGGGMTVPIGRRVEQTGVILALMVLGSTGNFQYEIWARPLGKVRRSIQSDPADDLDLQRLIKSTVPRISEDPLCTSVAACNFVAEQELMEIILQRSRVILNKTAHLQDEDGDTLQIPHWYTGRPMKVFVTDLTRRMKIPASEDDEGYFLDEIEGWRLPA